MRCESVHEMFEDGQLIADLEQVYGLTKNQWKLSDIKTLWTLITTDWFYADNCAHCGTRFIRVDPDNWQDFQGCHSDEGLGELCEDCTALYLTLKKFAQE